MFTFETDYNPYLAMQIILDEEMAEVEAQEKLQDIEDYEDMQALESAHYEAA